MKRKRFSLSKITKGLGSILPLVKPAIDAGSAIGKAYSGGGRRKRVGRRRKR